MDPDLIPEHELRSQKARLQPHPSCLVSVPISEHWMPQLVTDSRREPTIPQIPQKMPPILTKHVQSDSNGYCRDYLMSHMDVKNSRSKYNSVQSLNGALKPRCIKVNNCKTDIYTHEPSMNRKTKYSIEDEKNLKKEMASTNGVFAKQEKLTSINVGPEGNSKTNAVFSSNLPHYMKPLNRNISNRSSVGEQTKGKVQSQPSIRKKAVSNLLPVRIQAKNKSSNLQSGFVISSVTQLKKVKDPDNSEKISNQLKTPIREAPPNSPVLQQSTQEFTENEYRPIANHDCYGSPYPSKTRNEVFSQASCQLAEKKYILEYSQSKLCRFKDAITNLSLSQTGQTIPVSEQVIDVNIRKPNKNASAYRKRVSFVTKKPSVCTPLKSRPKTKGIQNRPYRGAVADPLKGELPPNGNLQCKPEGMKNFISTIGMPFYGLPVSQTPQYSDTYLDMLDEAGITLRKAIKESVKLANRKLQDPKPWMPSRFACPPRKRPVSPHEFTRRPRSPETLIWRLAKEDILFDNSANSRMIVPPVRGKTPGKKPQGLGSKKLTTCDESKTCCEDVVIKKTHKKTTSSVDMGDMDSSAQQKTAARILALMEKSVVKNECSCNAAQRLDSLVTQNIHLRQEVRQLERLAIKNRHADKLRERSRMDVNIKQNLS